MVGLREFYSNILSYLEAGYDVHIKKRGTIYFIDCISGIEEVLIQIYPDGTINTEKNVRARVKLREVLRYINNNYSPEDENIYRLISGSDSLIIFGKVYNIEPRKRSIEEALVYLMDLLTINGIDPDRYTITVTRHINE